MQHVKVTMIIALLASLFAISAAFFMQYVMGLLPCKLCFMQRNLYYITIAISCFGLYGIMRCGSGEESAVRYKGSNPKLNDVMELNKKAYDTSRIWSSITKSSCYVVIAVLLVGVGVAGFQFGVEKRIFRYNSSCSLDISDDMTVEEFQQKIEQADLVSCDMPQGVFLGVSIAGWNGVYSIVLFVILLLAHNNKLPKIAYAMMHKVRLI